MPVARPMLLHLQAGPNFIKTKTKLKLEDSREVTAGSEMSREALISIFTKSSSQF